MIELKFSGNTYEEVIDEVISFLEDALDPCIDSEVSVEEEASVTGIYDWANTKYKDQFSLFEDDKYGGALAVWKVTAKEPINIWASVGTNDLGGHIFENNLTPNPSQKLQPGATFIGRRKVLEAGIQADGQNFVELVEPMFTAVRYSEVDLVGKIDSLGRLVSN